MRPDGESREEIQSRGETNISRLATLSNDNTTGIPYGKGA